MSYSKFSLADLLTVLGALVFGFICFLSLNFLTLGDITQSVIWACLISCVLGGLAFGVKLIKSTSGNFKTYIILEWTLLALFFITAFVAFFPFSHYFAVSAQKEEIQKEVLKCTSQAEGLFGDYENNYANPRLSMYKKALNSIVLAKKIDSNGYRNFGFSDTRDDSTQIAIKVFALRAQLYPTNYNQMKQVDSIWLAEAKGKVSPWSPIGIVTVVNTLEQEITSWRDQLIIYSSYRAKGEDESLLDYNYPFTFNHVSDRFITSRNPPFMAIIISILLYTLMLFSYIFTKRSSKSSYTLFSFFRSKDKSLDDEIDIRIE